MSSQQPGQMPADPTARPQHSSGGREGSTSLDMPASLLKRVAEAAAGLRDGRRVWFVAQREFPHALEAFHDEGQADAAVETSDGRRVKVGPCLTPDDRAGRKRVEWIKVKLEGSEKPVELDPEKVDALFFSRSALDKFFYPYYTALYGPEEAARMCKRYENAAMICHRPMSEPCEENGDTT
ncbi:MAG: hypothetical protein ACREM1_06845 [Longimicrobiales bacterium]